MEKPAPGDIAKEVGLANSLLGRGKRAAALRELARLREVYPNSAVVWLESAGALDFLGREAEAIPLYERALQLGLEGAALRDGLVCLASSLREVGRSPEALPLLKQANRRFPRDPVVKMFLALVYHDLGRVTDALRLVSLTYLRESVNADLGMYQRPLRRKYIALIRRGRSATV